MKSVCQGHVRDRKIKKMLKKYVDLVKFAYDDFRYEGYEPKRSRLSKNSLYNSILFLDNISKEKLTIDDLDIIKDRITNIYYILYRAMYNSTISYIQYNDFEEDEVSDFFPYMEDIENIIIEIKMTIDSIKKLCSWGQKHKERQSSRFLENYYHVPYVRDKYGKNLFDRFL